jgi:1-acyl-sn-glycerol-3-phosphate acyltransferase
MGAVPVNRKQDVGENEAVSNDELFASSYDELDKGNIILLFPEGKSVHAPKIFPLKKGVGWLVQGYFKKTGRIVSVVPCALNYMKKEKFRSGVLVEFGALLFVRASALTSTANTYDRRSAQSGQRPARREGDRPTDACRQTRERRRACCH